MTTQYRFGKSHWREFTKEDLDQIEKERSERGIIEQLSKHQYGKICPACSKPNTPNVEFCTGCSFPLVEQDVQKLPDNIFLDIIHGRYTETTVLYRDDEICLFNDKFGVSIPNDHIDVIPIEEIEDVLSLTKEHIPLLEKLFDRGIEEFQKRDLSRFDSVEGFDLRRDVIAGYNWPVSVKHLHLHMVLPPFKHHKVFQYPRWHSHQKIVNDLKEFGKVQTYQETPNDEEGRKEYAKAINLHNAVSDNKFDPFWKTE
ncbi:hypothetical protein ABK040_000107 [Willaertia magna]